MAEGAQHEQVVVRLERITHPAAGEADIPEQIGALCIDKPTVASSAFFRHQTSSPGAMLSVSAGTQQQPHDIGTPGTSMH